MSIPLKTQRFIDANRQSGLVYQSASADLDEITFRLSDGSKFALTAAEARAIDQADVLLRWAHLKGVTA